MEHTGDYEGNGRDSLSEIQRHNGNNAHRPLVGHVYDSANDRNQSINTKQQDQEFQPPVIARTGVLEFITICVSAGIMIHHPVIQQYIFGRLLTEHSHDAIQDKTHTLSPYNSSEREVCSNISGGAREQIAQKDSARWLLYIGLANVIPSMFSTMILGSIMDFKGRKFGMIVPSIGCSILMGITMLVIKFSWPLYVLVIFSFIDGCLGSYGTIFTAAYAYLADITAPGKQRTWRIMVLEALIGISASGVSVGLGYFIKACGFFWPMALSVGLFVLNIIVIVFCLPETVKCRSDARIISIASLFKSVATYLRPREGTRRLQLIFMILVYFLINMAVIYQVLFGALFLMGMPFCWRSVTLGIFSAVGTVIPTFSMLTLLRPLRVCMHENIVCMIGILSTIGFLTLFGLSTNDVMVFLAPVVGLFLKMPPAIIKSASSQLVDKDEQGSLFAGFTCVRKLCFFFGVSFFGSLYTKSVESFPGLGFLVMAGVVFIALLLIGIVEVLRRKDESRPGYQELPICRIEGDKN